MLFMIKEVRAAEFEPRGRAAIPSNQELLAQSIVDPENWTTS
jgi:hypothetical protein